jgi:hypothetical protein
LEAAIPHQDCFRLGDRGIRALAPIGEIGPVVGPIRETLEDAKQGFEMLGLTLDRLTESRWDRRRRDLVGSVMARPRAGDIGRAAESRSSF